MTNFTANLQTHLQSVETQLGLLLNDLSRLERFNLSDAEESRLDQWETTLEGFRVKALTIRRILDRFHNADLPTRRYLRQHLDEEFAQLKNSYDSLREQFTAKDEVSPQSRNGGQIEWNG